MSFLVATAKQKTGELFSHLLSKDGLGLEYPETNRFLSSYLRWGSCRGCHLAMSISSRGLSQSWDTAALEGHPKKSILPCCKLFGRPEGILKQHGAHWKLVLLWDMHPSKTGINGSL